MRTISFKDWLVAQEDSAFGRARKAAALDLGPDIPDASINSRNTAPPWQQELFKKKKKGKKKDKDKDKDEDSDSKEVSEKAEPSVHTDIDSWIKSADNLKRDLDKLKATLGAKTQKVTVKGKSEPDDSDSDEDDTDAEEKPSKKPFPPKPEKSFPPKLTKPEKVKSEPEEEPEEPEEVEKPKSPKSKTAFSAFIARKETKK